MLKTFSQFIKSNIIPHSPSNTASMPDTNVTHFNWFARYSNNDKRERVNNKGDSANTHSAV